MGQVPAGKNFPGAEAPDRRPPEPARLLLIGDGKLARHLALYFTQLGLSFGQWSRRAGGPLGEALAGVTHALTAVSDGAIEAVARDCAEAAPKARRVHFSGSLATPIAWSAHPLMSFPRTLFSPERYARIPFVIENGGPSFGELLPGLPNPHFSIESQEKPLYHALCVLSGNFTVLLWQKFFAEMQERFGIPRESALEYLRAISANLEAESFPLTGPLARGDDATIARNLAALEGDPYREVYLSFVSAYRRQSVPSLHQPEAPAL